MSINVTVKGNPISIKHGKMMTVDPNYEKKEFEKRRLMRLEQVRQQSKEIAESIRNKVHKEKKKQMNEIEKEGKDKIKNWQTRKLLELQNQYKEALEELGMGHKEAAAYVNEDIVLEQQKEVNKAIAKNRGKTAATMLQIEKNEESFKKAMPIQRKKVVRDIENTRAALVTNLKKKTSGHVKKNTKKHKTSADISITIPNCEQSMSSSQRSEAVNSLSHITEEKTESASTSAYNDVQVEITAPDAKYKGPRRSFQRDGPFDLQEKISDHKPPPTKLDLEYRPSRSYSETIKKQEDIIESFRKNKPQVPYDTRISDRIKQREILAAQPDYCDLEPELYSAPKSDFKWRHRDNVGSGYAHNLISTEDSSDSDKCICCRMKCCNKLKRDIIKDGFGKQRNNKNIGSFNFQTDYSKPLDKERQVPVATQRISQSQTDAKLLRGLSSQTPIQVIQDNFTDAVRPDTDKFSKITSADIPSKPPVILRTDGTTTRPNIAPTFETDKVPYYDHRNRFLSKKDATFSNVEKITSDSLEVLPNTVSEAEWRGKMRQRDREAQIRGKKALEREKVQRDYQEIVQKLPLLQKKERIQEMYKDKPEYHMSDDRLRELERRRQNALENAYTKAMPGLQPAIVTLPNKKYTVPPPNEKFKNIEPTDSHTLNVGKWDVDHQSPKLFSAEEVQDIIKVFTGQKPKDRQTKLKELLKSLKLQKEQLINEIKALPKDDSIQALLTDLNSFTDSDQQKKKSDKTERKRRRDEDASVSESSTSSDIKSSEKGEREVRCTPKKKHSKPPKKKAKKSRQRVMILQNTSTQTTPKAAITDDEKRSLKETSTSRLQPVEICEKTHIPCRCTDQKSEAALPEELCKIYIKINEDDSPQVIVKNNKDQTEKTVIAQSKLSIESTKLVKTRTVAVGTESINGNQPLSSKPRSSEKTTHKTKPEQKRPPKIRVTSWRDQLSKNSVSTTSTSYYSPPDLSKTSTSEYNLKKKPQQDNIDNMSTSSSSRSSRGDRTIDPGLLNYVRKLLSMSRISIDELAVSSSDVQTPSQSVIEVETNNPMTQLHNIIKLFNLQAEDVAEQLSNVCVPRNVPDNSLASTEKSSTCESQKCSSKIIVPERDSVSSSEQIKQSVISQYEKISDSCDQRIANIASMIDKLREEKVKLTEKLKQTNATEKEHSSTTYLDLPSKSDKSTTSSYDEDELNKKLLEIDMDLAKKLRIFVSPRDECDDGAVVPVKSVAVEKPKKRVQIVEGSYKPDTEDEEFMKRLERLLQKSPTATSQLPDAPQNKDVAFVPFLSNIPKLPKLDSFPAASSAFKDMNGHKHPPPSKGLTVAKKFNDNINLIPHELSTIVEADSQLSTKISSAQISPSTTKLSSRKKVSIDEDPGKQRKGKYDLKDKNLEKSPTSVLTVQAREELDPSKAITSLSCVSLEGFGASLSSSTSKKTVSSSSGSVEALDSIEAMLRSIGMEWAIPTLHKTQEALALTSSSSSISLNMKNKSVNSSSSGSEISLKDFLQKQVLTRISSSTLKSDATQSAFELTELSAIQAANNSSSGEKSQRKTSTPVLISTKSSSKSKDSNKQPDIFTAESDISSVKFTSLSESNNNSSSKSSR